MSEHQLHITVRYAETDQMGYVHHSIYPLYLEQARMDMFSTLGMDVNALENEGVILPVVSMEIRYLLPLYFGDRLRVDVKLSDDMRTRFKFSYRLYNQNEELVAKAKTSLVLADKKSGKLLSLQEIHSHIQTLKNS